MRQYRNNMKTEKGAVMVETVVILPIVMMAVFFLLYLGLIKLQDMAIIYQVQRTAHQGSLILASPGYKELGPHDYDKKQIDFASSSAVTQAQAEEYYKAYHKDILSLYREIFGYCGWTSREEIQAFLEKMGDDTMMLAGVSLFEEKASLHRGFLGIRLDTEVTFGFPAPGVLRYFGYEGRMEFKQGASSLAVSPSAVVRNVDLACDAFVAVRDKLNLDKDGNLEKMLEGIKEYLF